MIDNAFKSAQNEHIVYFLLTSYLAACSSDDHASALPAQVKRFPIAGRSDVDQRLRALTDALSGAAVAGARTSRLYKEAVNVFSAASERIATLQGAAPSLKS